MMAAAIGRMTKSERKAVLQRAHSSMLDLEHVLEEALGDGRAAVKADMKPEDLENEIASRDAAATLPLGSTRAGHRWRPWSKR